MRKLLLSSISLFALASSSFADDTETVVVTATRTPQPASRTGQSIDVITAKDLETRQIDVVTDVLQETPGLMVNRNGGAGQVTSVSLRGAETGQSVVLVDGVRINDPSLTDDGALLGDLLTNNIERIEILRGPQSTLYGSDAIGGVVNVITRRGGANPGTFIATAEGGALDTFHLNAAANGTADHVDYGAGLNYYNTRSVSAADSRNGNPEPDPYRNLSATANTRVHFDSGLSVDLRGYFVRSHVSYDDNFKFVPPSTFEVADSKAFNTNEFFAGYAGVNYDMFDGLLKNRLAIITTTSTRKFFNSAFDSPPPGQLDFSDYGDAIRFEYQGIVRASDADEITFGIESERTSFRGNSYSSGSVSESDAGHTRTTGYYVHAQHRVFEQLTITGGVRLEDNDEFGTHVATKVAAAWQIPGWDATLRGNFGDGFKAPSLFERFSQFSPPPSAPEPELKPEVAKGWEIGADKAFLDNRIRASLTYFDRRTGNLIDFFNCFGVVPPNFAQACIDRAAQGGFYFNEGRTFASGVETEVSLKVTDEVSLSANYTNLTAKNRNNDLPLQRRPHVEANGILDWRPSPDSSAGGSITFVGPRFDDAAATIRLPGTVLFNIFGSYELTDEIDVFARVENLFDKHYEPVFGFGAPGRTMFAGVRLRG